MQVHVVDYSPESNNPKKKNSFLQKFFVGFFAALIIINVSVFSFLIGRNMSSSEASPTGSNIAMSKTDKETLGTQSETATSAASAEQSNRISPTPTLAENINELSISSTPELDGFWASDGTGSSIAGIQIGRNPQVVTRGFLTFDLTSVPEGVSISEAKVRLYLVREEGSVSPMGDLMVDHVRYGDSLDASDYSSVAILSSFTELTRSGNTNNWLEADITDAVLDDIDRTRANTQYRIHFENEVRNVSPDFLFIESGENYFSSNYPPELIIRHSRK